MEGSDDSRDTLILQNDDEDAPAPAQVCQSFNNKIILGTRPCRPAADDSESDETEHNSVTKQTQYEDNDGGRDVKQRVRKRSKKNKNKRRRIEKRIYHTNTDAQGVINETCEHCGEVFTDIKVFSAHAKAIIVPKNKSRIRNMISKKLRSDQRFIMKNFMKSRKMWSKLSNRTDSKGFKTLKRQKKYSNDDRNRCFENHNDKNQNIKRNLSCNDTASKKPKLDDETKVLNKENTSSKVVEIYKCICGLHFTSTQFVEKHVDVCNNNFVQKEFCSRCNLPFATECLVDHLWRHHHGNGDCSFRFVYVEKPESLLVEHDKGVETTISEKPPLRVMGIDPCLIKELHFVDYGILLDSNDGEYDEHNLEINKQKDTIAKTSATQNAMGNLSTCNKAVENVKDHQPLIAENVQENNNHYEIKEELTEFNHVMQHDIEELNLMKQTICCEVNSSNTAFSLHDTKKLQNKNEILEIDEDQPFYEEKIKEETEKNTDEKESQEVSELQDENEILEIDEDQPFYEEKIKEETEKNTNEKETQEVSELNQEINEECFQKIMNEKGSSEVVTVTNQEINKDHEISPQTDKTDPKTNEKSLKEPYSNAATENKIDIFNKSSKTLKNATKKLINANNLRKCSGLDKNNNKNNKKPYRNVSCNTKKDHVNENKRVEKVSEQMTKQIRTKARRWISQQNLSAQYFGNIVTPFYGSIVYRCHKCSLYFARRDALAKHNVVCSDKIEGSPCPICNLSFAKGLAYHVYVHHEVMGLKLDEIQIIEDLQANYITPSKHKPQKTVKEDCVKLDGCKVTKDTLIQNITSFKDKPDNIKDVSQIHDKPLFKDKPKEILKDSCVKLEFKVTGAASNANDITTTKEKSEKTMTFNSVKSLKVRVRGNDLQMNITSSINKPDDIVKVNSHVTLDKNKIIQDASETDHKTFLQKPINGNDVKLGDDKLMKNSLRVKDINTLIDIPDKTMRNCVESNKVRNASQANQMSQGIPTVITSKLEVLRNKQKLQTSPNNSLRYYAHTSDTTHSGNANNTASYIGTNPMEFNTNIYNNSQNTFAAKCIEKDNCEPSKIVQDNYQTVNNSLVDNREYAHWIQSQNMNVNLNNDFQRVECPAYCLCGQNNPGFERTRHFVPDYHNTLQPTPVVPNNMSSNPQYNNMTNYYHNKSNYDGHIQVFQNSNLEQYNDFRNKYFQNYHSPVFNNIRHNILNNVSSQCDYLQRGPYAPSDYLTSNHIRELAYMCQYQQ